MTSQLDGDHDRKRRRLHPPQDGPYVLRPVIQDVPLNADGDPGDVHITAVEHWNSNLYIGTSASEVLHFVSIPSEPNAESDEPTYILASRIQPSSTASSSTDTKNPGVQQILLLPAAGKACILCNGVATFYSLPELSPAFGNTKVANCRWIGGLDENTVVEDGAGEQVIMIAAASRMMLVRIGEEARRIRNIEFPGCLKSVRRDTIACVADNHSYSLLDVEHQQKIPLFPISSLDDSERSHLGKIEDLPPAPSSPLPARTSSLAHRPLASPEPRGHERSASLNVPRLDSHMQRSPRPVSSDLSGLNVPDFPPPSPSRPGSVSPPRRIDSPSLPRTSTPDPGKALPPPPKGVASLKPQIVSPTPSEFLLTTGTADSEPGVGIFVNLDGDVVRGTMEFLSYPETLLVDRPCETTDGTMASEDDDKSLFIVAVVVRRVDGDISEKVLEIHELGENSDGTRPEIIGLGIGAGDDAGLYNTFSLFDRNYPDMVDSLRLVRLKMSASPRSTAMTPDPRTQASLEQVEREKALFDSQISLAGDLPSEQESQREREELIFAKRLGYSKTRTVLWSGASIWNLSRNPLLMQLDAKLLQASQAGGDSSPTTLHTRLVMALMSQIRDREATTEAEFLSLEFIRQKAGLMLFVHAIHNRTMKDREAELRLVENTLMESNLDPRVALLMLPILREDVIQGPNGIWLHRGIVLVAEKALSIPTDSDTAVDVELLGMIRRYLATWQGKRGFGSISDEKQVFDSVDGALLHTLLHLDQELPENSAAATSVRAKLNNVVDNWKGDFERAIALLEQYKRLFVLSRLYQSRKLAKDVLATWKRIIEGEQDPSGELTPEAAEVRIRRYLITLRNAQLVEEYGLWLAQRNPELAIQAFTDDNSRVKFEPTKLTSLLKDTAPNAVQQYLEYLVFNKNQPQYGDDLIGYYLDSMLSVLENSEEARTSLAESYSTYRALSAPKPTYLTFITQNAPQESWWQSRLRLLHLLGSGSTYASVSASSSQLTYSIPTVLARLAPFSKYLVSESVILDARQGHHSSALDSLIHGLGDYDTAIRYCYFGGPSPTASQPIDSSALPDFNIQRSLFHHLLSQFLKIESSEDSLERTGDLLAKFSSWFNPMEVLAVIPSDWPVELLSEFFSRTLRKLRAEMDETLVVRGLAAAENLQKQAEWVEGCEKLGALFEDAEGVLRGQDDTTGDGKKGSNHDDDDDRNGNGDGTAASSIAEVREILGGDDLVVS